jgi:hypothetical protein
MGFLRLRWCFKWSGGAIVVHDLYLGVCIQVGLGVLFCEEDVLNLISNTLE